MNNYNQVYIGIDLHSKHSTIGFMNEEGRFIGQHEVQTTANNLINQVTAIPAERKQLTLEQSNMAFWAAEQLREHVDRLIVCEPRYNALISGSENKNDHLDTLRLCRLLRLGELKEVWRPTTMGIRRLFYQQVKEYQRVVKILTTRKRQLQASLRHWGIPVELAKKDYTNPGPILDQLPQPLLAEELAAQFRFIQHLSHQKDQQFGRLSQTATDFWEISEFQKMAGIGPVGSHIFSGYIQTPHRFRKRSQLIKFCKLAVRTFTSDGRTLRNQRLSKAGHGCLKNVAHIAWKTAVGKDNEVNGFYQASLARCGNPVKARLNTQRKILTTLWSVWKHKRTYRPEKFFSGGGDSAR